MEKETRNLQWKEISSRKDLNIIFSSQNSTIGSEHTGYSCMHDFYDNMVQINGDRQGLESL